MRHTLFAGLTQLDPLDPLSADDYSFQTTNPEITDRLLEVGAVTHRHDGHAALANPADAPDCETIASGGQVPGGVTFDFAYTLVDADRGETAASPICSTTTPAPLSAPEFSPDAVVDYTAGQLTADAYYYAETWIDGDGGETTLGAIAPVDVDPYPNARVLLSGLASGMPAGAVGWRLYRGRGGENFHYLASGTADSIIDDGTLCAQCQVFPPVVNSTTQTATLQAVIPAIPSGAVGWRLYSRVQSAAWPTNSYMGSGAVGDVTQVFATFSPAFGKPPPVSRALRGAHQIDPDTDLLDWHWKRPVASAGALPLVGNASGDVRARLNDGGLSIWLNEFWQSTGGGGGAGGYEAVGDVTSTPGSAVVPLVEEEPGIRRLLLDFDVPALGAVDDLELTLWVEMDADPANLLAVLIPPQMTFDDGWEVWESTNAEEYGTASAGSGSLRLSHHADREIYPDYFSVDPLVGLFRPWRDPAFLAWRGRDAEGTWTLQLEHYGAGAATVKHAELHFMRGVRREGHTFTVMGDVPASGTMPIPAMPVAAHPDSDVRLVKVRHKLASGAASGLIRNNGGTVLDGLTIDTTGESVYPYQPLEADDELELVITTLFGSPKGLSLTLHTEQTVAPGRGVFP